MNGHKGFTLLELLACCTLIAIFAGLSLNILQLLYNWRLKAATDQLFHHLQSARSLALQRQKPTIVCATQNQTSCSNNWSDGVAIFIDENENLLVDSTDTTVYTTLFEYEILVKWKAFQNKSHLTFTPEGFTDHQNGRFYLCIPDSGHTSSRQIIVSKSGRARLALGNAGDTNVGC